MTQRVVRSGWLAFFAAVFVAPVVARLATTSAEPMWRQLTDVTGLLALSGLVCAAVLPSRVRSITRAFGIEDVLDVHRFVGVASGVLVLIHLACVVAMNPAQVALLDPALNGPPAKAASVATAALVMLVVLAAARRRLNQRYEVWRWCHVLLAITTLVGSALHVYLLNHLIQQRSIQLVLVLLGLAVGAVLAHRWVWRTLLDPSTEFVVAEIRRESETVTTVSLAARDGPVAEWAFCPGQFAWLRLHRSVTGEEHPFTIASSPHLPGRVEFTIRHAGDFTRTVHRLRPAARLGRRAARRVHQRHPHLQGVVMFAGGVGITPMMSMVRAAAHRGDPRAYRLIVVARTTRTCCSATSSAELRDYIDLEVTEVLRRPVAGWQGPTGEINVGLLPPCSAGDHHPPSRLLPLRSARAGPRRPGGSRTRSASPADRVHTEQFDMA